MDIPKSYLSSQYAQELDMSKDIELVTINLRVAIDHILRLTGSTDIDFAKSIIEDMVLINAEEDMGIYEIDDNDNIFTIDIDFLIRYKDDVRQLIYGIVKSFYIVIIGWVGDLAVITSD